MEGSTRMPIGSIPTGSIQSGFVGHELQCTLFGGINSITTGILLSFLIEESTMRILFPNIEPMDSNVFVITSIMRSKSDREKIKMQNKSNSEAANLNEEGFPS
jgi:hypothetical protein